MSVKYNHPSQSVRMPNGGKNAKVVLFEGALYEEAALYATLGVDLSPSPVDKPKD